MLRVQVVEVVTRYDDACLPFLSNDERNNLTRSGNITSICQLSVTVCPCPTVSKQLFKHNPTLRLTCRMGSIFFWPRHLQSLSVPIHDPWFLVLNDFAGAPRHEPSGICVLPADKLLPELQTVSVVWVLFGAFPEGGGGLR